MELVSVIVPVYNVEAYIHQCLSSIQNQEYDSFECIVVDDGSKDSSGEIAGEYARNDPRFRVLHQDNRGVSVARNAGLDIAMGKYIVFVDGDDYLEADYIKKMVKEIERLSVDIVCSDHKIVTMTGGMRPSDEHQKRCKIAGTAVCLSDLIDSAWLNCCWGKIYLRKSIEEKRFPIGMQLGEDTTYVLSCLSSCRIAVSLHNGYCYRDTMYGLSTKYNEELPVYLNQYHQVLARFTESHAGDDLGIKKISAIKISKERLRAIFQMAAQETNYRKQSIYLRLLFENGTINRYFRNGCIQDENPIMIKLFAFFPVSTIWLVLINIYRIKNGRKHLRG